MQPAANGMSAMILAAGRGERMRPLTDHTPKPLLHVGGKPLLVWHIERLAAAGFRDLIINHAHLGHQIEQALGDGDALGVRIRYSAEGTALETAGGIAQALPLLGDAPFVVVNGDIFCDFDFTTLPARAAALSADTDLAHLILCDNPDHHPEGDFGLEDGRVTAGTPALTFSGIGLYHPALFAGIAHGQKAALGPLLRARIAANRISGEHHRGLWRDIGTPQRLTELDKLLGSLQNDRHD